MQLNCLSFSATLDRLDCQGENCQDPLIRLLESLPVHLSQGFRTLRRDSRRGLISPKEEKCQS